jgi:hypothetical protein
VIQAKWLKHNQGKGAIGGIFSFFPKDKRRREDPGQYLGKYMFYLGHVKTNDYFYNRKLGF